MRFIHLPLLILTFLCYGCGSNLDTFVATQPASIPTTGSIQVDQPLFRGVSTFVTSFRFSGLSQSDDLLYGPVEVSKTTRTVLEDVPLTVQNLRIEYLANQVIIGRFETAVQVVAGATVVIDNPAWLDTPPVAPIFAAPVAQLAGTLSVSVATGDLNGDERQDVVVSNSTSGDISVLLGIGDGTFGTATQIPTGTAPFQSNVTDLNRDGHADIAVSNFGIPGVNIGSFSVLLGAGDGTFGAPVDIAVQNNPISSSAADFDGDGDQDLAVANYESQSVSVLLGNGDGTFQAAVNFAAGARPHDIQIADYNHDGNLDMAVANEGLGMGGDLSVLLGRGDGTFQGEVRYTTGQNPRNAAIADLDGDGNIDVVTANFTSGDTSVLLGVGDGTFTDAVTYSAGPVPLCVIIEDFNQDGRPDLAFANQIPGVVSILAGNGDGTFASRVSFASGNNTFYIASADFNGDGMPDIVAANADIGNNGNVATLLGTQP